ncbi:hypothetical protein GLOIN_2v1480379 [Rhizophagus clarus]|uniref:Bromo domain-containing protein n=1 Tax=Rhizophagus clarus TaxID=94130 RepID=A0A8H3KUT6_9GLOM|nr:hypothetical protein GLOIN_2v1480379 [Rhizophagus clarus]
MSATTNGYEALIYYLKSERKNWSYYGFLKLNQDTIIASLVSLINNSSITLSKWQSIDAAWFNRFLNKAKELLEPSTFDIVKKKVVSEHIERKKNLQIFWYGIIKEYRKENQRIIKEKENEKEKEYEKETSSIETYKDIPVATTITFLSKEILDQNLTVTPFPKETVNASVENVSKTLQSNKLINFCYDIFHKLENSSYAQLFYKYNEKDIVDKGIKHPMDLFTINSKLENEQYTNLEEFEYDVQLIFRNCYTYNDVKSEIYCSGLQKKQNQILEENNNITYEQVINDTLPVTLAHENLAIDIFVLKGTGDNYICLELKYISLAGLIKNQNIKFGANELENLDKILEKENEEFLLKRPYTYWSKEHKKTNQTTIGDVLNNGIDQLRSYVNIISKGRPVDYTSSGVFDKRIKITKSEYNILKGYVILVIGFRRILWRSVEEVISNYTYNKV